MTANPSNADAILDAARHTIVGRGSGKLRLSATAAGDSPHTLYRWYPTKDDLLTGIP